MQAHQSLRNKQVRKNQVWDKTMFSYRHSSQGSILSAYISQNSSKKLKFSPKKENMLSLPLTIYLFTMMAVQVQQHASLKDTKFSGPVQFFFE
jgi:hypothetical protein